MANPTGLVLAQQVKKGEDRQNLGGDHPTCLSAYLYVLNPSILAHIVSLVVQVCGNITSVKRYQWMMGENERGLNT